MYAAVLLMTTAPYTLVRVQCYVYVHSRLLSKNAFLSGLRLCMGLQAGEGMVKSWRVRYPLLGIRFSHLALLRSTLFGALDCDHPFDIDVTGYFKGTHNRE
jgi:hypothetical protein